MPQPRETYAVEIAGVKRNLPLFEVKPGLRIAVLNILGDTPLVEAAAGALAQKLGGVNYDLLVTAEAKSIPLIHALSVRVNKPYVVLRKTYKPYMGETIQAETLSITTGAPQTLHLDEKDRVREDSLRAARSITRLASTAIRGMHLGQLAQGPVSGSIVDDHDRSDEVRRDETVHNGANARLLVEGRDDDAVRSRWAPRALLAGLRRSNRDLRTGTHRRGRRSSSA